MQRQIDDAGRKPLPLKEACEELQDRLQELGEAFLGKHGGKLVLVALFADLGVRVAAEEAVCDVQHPLLGLPPGPRRPHVQVLWHSLLHNRIECQIQRPSQMDTADGQKAKGCLRCDSSPWAPAC